MPQPEEPTQPLSERVRSGISSAASAAYGALAGHNPPLPKFAKAATRSGKLARKVVPRHMQGRGLISPKAMAAMGKAQAAVAQPPKGQHHPAKAGHVQAGMSPTGKHGAQAARPPKGQHKPAMAKPAIGTHVAQDAPGDIV
jgi:hypothetical protein